MTVAGQSTANYRHLSPTSVLCKILEKKMHKGLFFLPHRDVALFTKPTWVPCSLLLSVKTFSKSLNKELFTFCACCETVEQIVGFHCHVTLSARHKESVEPPPLKLRTSGYFHLSVTLLFFDFTLDRRR